MGAKRLEQIGEEIRHVIGQLLVSGNVRDPRLAVVSVHKVKVAADLQIASLYFGILSSHEPSPSDIQNTLKALQKASGFLRTHIAHTLSLRVTPQFRFFYDDSLEKTQKVLNLLSSVRQHDSVVSHQESVPIP